MGIFKHGDSPTAIYAWVPDQRAVSRVYVWNNSGEHLVFDETLSAFVSAPTATATAQGRVPVASAQPAAITAPAPTATATAAAPTLTATSSLVAPRAGSVAAGQPPSAGASALFVAPIATAGADAYAIVADATVVPPLATAAAAGLIPTVDTPGSNGLVVPPIAAATAAAAIPAVATIQTILVPFVTAAATAAPPALTATAALTSDAAAATAGSAVPAVSAAKTVTAVVTSATAAAMAPTIAVTSMVSPTTVGATAMAKVPTVIAGSSIAAVVTNATASGTAPTPTANANITAVAATATATARVPVVATVLIATDDFNRADGGLGSDWTTISNAPVIATNKAQGGTTGASGATTIYASRNNNLFTADTPEEVVFTLATPTGTAALGNGGGAWLRGTSGTASATHSRVSVGFTNSMCYINLWNGTGGANQQTFAFGTFTSGMVVRFAVVGNVYSAYVDGSGTATVTWTDSFNYISQSNHYWGIETVTSENFSGIPSYGFAIDTITATG